MVACCAKHEGRKQQYMHMSHMCCYSMAEIGMVYQTHMAQMTLHEQCGGVMSIVVKATTGFGYSTNYTVCLMRYWRGLR